VKSELSTTDKVIRNQTKSFTLPERENHQLDIENAVSFIEPLAYKEAAKSGLFSAEVALFQINQTFSFNFS